MVTVIVAVPLAVSFAPVIVACPGSTPVTSPDALTVATLGGLLLQLDAGKRFLRTVVVGSDGTHLYTTPGLNCRRGPHG